MRRVIVTGVSSFIGAHLADGFSRSGWQVIATTTRPHVVYSGMPQRRIKWLNGKVNWVICDITDEKSVRGLIAEYKPDLWIHHAGDATNYSSLDYNIERGFSVNVCPLYFIYDELKKSGSRGVIVTGSSMEYGDSDLSCCETDVCYPATPYGLSKLSETVAALQLSKRFDLPTRVCRIFIPFGPFDSENRLVPSVLNCLKNKISIDLSPCIQKRDFLYIGDIVRAYLMLADNLDGGGAIYNICSGYAVPVKEMIETIATSFGVSEALLRFGARPMRPGETMLSYGSNEKLKGQSEWSPRPLLETVKEYISYENTNNR